MSKTLTVEGMSCGGCEQHIVESLEDLDAVTHAEASHEEGTATIEGDADVDDLVAAVKEAGYTASA